LNPLRWKRGDTRPVERVQLTEPDPTVPSTLNNPTPRRGIDLDLASSVVLVMRSRDGRRTVTAPAVIVAPQSDAANRGWLEVDPSTTPAITAVAGLFAGEFVVTWSGGAIQRVPNDGTLTVEIEDALS
jgi:hypothetical protein